MRSILVCACLLGCAHDVPQPSITLASTHTELAPVSFRERTRPHHAVKDVSHVEVDVHRVEGPESIVLGFGAIDRLATTCWSEQESLVIYPTDYDTSVTLKIDTRADGTMEGVEIEPVTTPKPIAMCLIHALAAQPLHVENGPQHLVLVINARVWWTR